MGEVRALPKGEDRKITFVASNSTRDRHQTVLNPNNWKLDNFNRNPVTGYQHNVYGDICNPPNPDDVLGPARAWVEEKRDNGQGELLVEIDFETKDLNPLADKIFRKIKNGSLRAVSVGFTEIGEGDYGSKEDDEHRGGENQTYYFAGQELLEVSVVNIPSNPEALKKQLRSNTRDALLYLVKAFGDKYSLSEIDEMRVCDIRQLLDNRKAIGPRVKMEGRELWYGVLDGDPEKKYEIIPTISGNKLKMIVEKETVRTNIEEEKQLEEYSEFLEKLEDMQYSVQMDKINNSK
jgi:HK97 family phage prohead protease